MRSKMIAICFSCFCMTCLSQRSTFKKEIETKIKAFETGLVPFTSPKEMLDARYDSSIKPLSIKERMEHYRVPGVSITLINNYDIEWSKAYGVTNSKSNDATSTSSIFQAASTSKFVVALIVLKLVEEGVLDLDEDVNRKLTSWRVPESEFTRDKKVTLRRLLTHSSGLNRPDGGFSYEGIPSAVEILSGGNRIEHASARIDFEPGSKWQYSNFGYVIIELLLEDVLGKAFEEIADKFVFDPLGMRNSTYDNSVIRSNEALPHTADGVPKNPVLHPTIVAHGGLFTTPVDLSKLAIEVMKAYTGKSSKIISKKMAELMLSEQMPLSSDMFGLPIGEGMGTFVRNCGDNIFSFFHPGENYPGTTSWLVGFQELGKGAVIMTNGAQGSLLTMEIIYSITREYEWPVAN